jgi:NAD(P) transhydrogenase subunit alpha
VVVDLAIETGGNVEGAVLGKIVNKNGVKIIGLENMPARVALNASAMYSNNLYNIVDEFWNKETKVFELNVEDDIIKGCLMTHNGAVVHPAFAPKNEDKKVHKG